MRRLLVVGGGVAGAAAAAAASERGAATVWVKGRAGASVLSSGAADLTPWAQGGADESLSPELERFVAALGAWTLGARSAQVLSAFGVVRPARARDPLVLDLGAHAGGTFAVVRFAGAHHCAGTSLGAALRESAWARQTSSQVVDHDVPDGAALEGEPPEIDAVFARLVRAPAPTAWLVPAHWIVDETRLRELERRLGRPVGCPLTEIGGALGARLGERLDAFAPPRVERVQGEVEAIDQRAGGGVARLLDGGASRKVEFDAAVLCVGGLAGGGIAQDDQGRLRLSLDLRGVEFEVHGQGRADRLDPASPGGVDYCALGHAAIAHIGMRTRAGRFSPSIHVAGDAQGGVPRTLLAAAQSGTDAVEALMGTP